MEDLTVSTPPVASGAGFWIRAGARLIDVFYGIALGFIGGVLAGISLAILDRSGLITPGWQDRIHGTNLAGWGLSLLGGFLYHTLTEGMYGASLGKLIFQLRVVREDGGPIGLGQAGIRSLGYYIDALFFGLIGYSAMKQSELNQRYGDKWAHTVVIRSSELPEGSRKGGEMFILALMMGSACWMVLNALGLIVHVL